MAHLAVHACDSQGTHTSFSLCGTATSSLACDETVHSTLHDTPHAWHIGMAHLAMHACVRALISIPHCVGIISHGTWHCTPQCACMCQVNHSTCSNACYSSLMVAITLHGTHRACIPHLNTHLASHITWHSLSGIWWLLRQHRQHSSAPSGCMAAVISFKVRPVGPLCLINDHYY